MKTPPAFEHFDRSLDREEAARRNTRPVEIATGLWGRLGTKARRDGMTRAEAITAALVAFVDGPAALLRYREKIGKVAPPVKPEAQRKQRPERTGYEAPWLPFMTGPVDETREARRDRLRQALALRFPGKLDIDREVPLHEALAFLRGFK